MNFASSMSPFSPSISYHSESVVRSSGNSTKSNSNASSSLMAVTSPGSDFTQVQLSKSNPSITTASSKLSTGKPLVAKGLNATDFCTHPDGPGASGVVIPGAMQAYKQSAPVLTETYCEICNRQFCNKVPLPLYRIDTMIL